MESQLTGTQVFEIHRDRLVCGVCKYRCEDVISLLGHKLQHTISDDVYKCELCKALFSSSQLLANHYHLSHKVALWFMQPQSTELQLEEKFESEKRKHKENKEDDEDVDMEDNLQDRGSEDDSIVISAQMIEDGKCDDNQQSDKKCYVEVIEASPDEQPELCGLNSAASSVNIDDIFNKHTETPFLLVRESESGKLENYIESWLVCIYCSQKMRDRLALISHIIQEHPNMKIEDLKVIDIDDIVCKSGITDTTSEALKYTKTLITLGEYNKLFCVQQSKPVTIRIEKKKMMREHRKKRKKCDIRKSQEEILSSPSTGDSDMAENNSLLDIDKTAQSEIDKISLLFVTVSSAKISDLYLKAWLICLHCSHKTCSRNPFINHVLKQHKNAKLGEIDIEDVLNNSGLLKDIASDVKLTKTVITMAEYDKLLPEIPSNKETKRRLEKQDIVGVFPCETCSKQFSRLRYLRRHVKTHHQGEKASYVCSECDKRFKTADVLRVHKKSVHAVDKTFKCESCEFMSNVSAAIHIHRQLHPNGSVVCHVCGRAYGDKSTLVKHLKVHDLSRPYGCRYSGCTWRFKSEVMMKAHFQSHISQGQYVCQRCGYAFRRKQHLQRHETKIHGLAPPKPRPYRNQIINHSSEDLIEIPSHQLEIDEACMFNNIPIFVTLETQEGPIVCETSDMSSLNTFMQTNLVSVDNDQDPAFSQDVQ